MKKKTLFVIAVLAVFIFALAACTERYKFDPPLQNTQGEVTAWGNSFVEKGNYFYFINGIQFPSDRDKNRWGEERLGMLVRVKIEDLGKEDDESIFETVVPKIIYSPNPSTAGFVIINEKIYYTTYNTERDASGNVQTDKLDIMSVNINGTGTKRLYTFDSGFTNFMVSVDANGKEYIVYYGSDNGGEIRAIEVVTGKDNLVDDQVSDYIFDSESREVFYTANVLKDKVEEDDPDEFEKYNVLKKYAVGSDPVVIRDGKLEDSDTDPVSYESFDLVSARDGIVWFALTSGRVAMGNTGLWKATKAEDAIMVSSISYTNFFAYKEVENDVLITIINGRFYMLTFASGSNGVPVESIELAVGADEGSVVFEYMSKSATHLYYSDGGMYRLDLSRETIVDENGQPLFQDPVQITEGNVGGTGAMIVVERAGGEIWVIYNTSGIKASEDLQKAYYYKSVYDEDEKEVVTVLISRTFEEEEE